MEQSGDNPVDEQQVLHDAISFTSHDSVLGHDTWSVDVRSTVKKLHKAGYRIVGVSDREASDE